MWDIRKFSIKPIPNITDRINSGFFAKHWIYNLLHIANQAKNSSSV